MRNLLNRHPLAFALALMAALLVAVIAFEAGVGMGLWPTQTPADSRPVPAAETKLVPPLAATNPDQAFVETTARPLFTPTRRPAPAAPAAGNVMVKGQFTLQGVIAAGDLRVALLREKSSGRVHRLEKGRDLNGITLTAVENDKVTLTQGGEQETLALQVQRGPAVAAAPAPAPAAPSAGPFGPAPGSAPAPGAPPQPGQPSAPGAVGAPAVAGAPAAPAPAPTPNPATRSGFGPFTSPPATPAATTSTPEQATPMTPEELLARRRARRAQQQQPQNQ